MRGDRESSRDHELVSIQDTDGRVVPPGDAPFRTPFHGIFFEA